MSTIGISERDQVGFHAQGWTAPSGRLRAALVEPVAQTAHALAARRPRQELLSGIHNPFGRAAALCDPWKFLDVCESPEMLDPVAALIGPDLVLWDSELYLDAGTWEHARPCEGRYWPADPLAGLVADVSLATAQVVLADVRRAGSMLAAAPGAHYVIRYMPATSLYNRDPRFPANRIAMEERPLVNYLNQPLWLVRGEDCAGSDFATGFAAVTPGWAADQTFRRMEV